MAEGVGFEPTVRLRRTHALQACALDHSATPPRGPASYAAAAAAIYPALHRSQPKPWAQRAIRVNLVKHNREWRKGDRLAGYRLAICRPRADRAWRRYRWITGIAIRRNHTPRSALVRYPSFEPWARTSGDTALRIAGTVGPGDPDVAVGAYMGSVRHARNSPHHPVPTAKAPPPPPSLPLILWAKRQPRPRPYQFSKLQQTLLVEYQPGRPDASASCRPSASPGASACG